jgi:hypothetical protein
MPQIAGAGKKAITERNSAGFIEEPNLESA